MASSSSFVFPSFECCAHFHGPRTVRRKLPWRELDLHCNANCAASQYEQESTLVSIDTLLFNRREARHDDRDRAGVRETSEQQLLSYGQSLFVMVSQSKFGLASDGVFGSQCHRNLRRTPCRQARVSGRSPSNHSREWSFSRSHSTT